MKAIVALISKRNAGLTRKEIIEALHIPDGGTATRALKALDASNFIVKYIPFGGEKRECLYKLIDPFCLFYLRFCKGNTEKNQQYFEQNVSSQTLSTWRGYAFENVCFNHIEQIKKALGISGIISSHSAWAKRDDDKGTQIDLLINRADNVVNMCELKFYGGDYVVDKDYYRILLNREMLLKNELNRKTVVRSTLITTFGLVRNEYSGIFTNVILMDDLFE